MNFNIIMNKINNHLTGGIVAVERDNTVHVATSNILNHTLQIERGEPPKLNTLNEILDQIYHVILKSNFSSKYSGVDEFSEICYGDDENDLIGKKINGSASFLHYPRGIILFHTKNQLLFDCLEIQYMMDNNAFPINLTSLSDEKRYKIERSDGSVHNCIIMKEYSIRFSNSREVYIIGLHFNTDKSDPGIRDYTDLIKQVELTHFMMLNEMNEVSLTIPYLDANNYDLDNCDISNDLAIELISYYNEQINTYITKTKDKFSDFTEVTVDNNTLTLKA